LPESDRDGLDRVRAHLDDAHAAADRLVREAQRQAEDAAQTAPSEEVPPRGWDATAGTPPRSPLADLQAIVGLIETVRRSIPPEITRQIAEALRDLLLALRALIDWYLERLDGGDGSDGRPVEDIPLD
jgi:hypothetical protein